MAEGGGSDGNFTAALGVPTLDGLGAVGGGAHADHEHLAVAEMVGRADLVAGLVDAIGGSAERSGEQRSHHSVALTPPWASRW